MNHLAILVAAALLASGSLGCAASSTPCAHVATASDAEHPCAMRAEAGSLWVSAGAWAAPRRAWTMPARGSVEQLAVAPLAGETGYVVTFRQGGVTWRGELGADRDVRGSLQPISLVAEGSAATAGR